MTAVCFNGELPWRRWLALTALLAAELVLLSVRFDTAALGAEPSGWAWVLGSVPQAVRLLGVILVASLLLSGPALIAEIEDHWSLAPSDSNGGPGWLLPLHLTSLLALVWLTAALLEQGRAHGPQAGLWMTCWACAATSLVGAWARLFLPLGIWYQLVVRSWRGLVLGAVTGTLVWAAANCTYTFWSPLAGATLWCVTNVLGLAYHDIVYRPEECVVGTSSFDVRIAPECSGFEGMGLMVAFLTVYLLHRRRSFRFPHALILIPMGAALIWCCNVLRIVSLISIGSSWSAPVALGGFHSQAGWLAFIGAALGMVALAGKVHWIRTASTTRPAAVRDPTVAYLGPLLAMLGVGSLTSAFSDGHDSLFPLRVIAAAAVLVKCRPHYRAQLCACSWTAVIMGLSIVPMWLLLARSDPFHAPIELLRAWPILAAVGWWVFRLVGFILITPIAEELAFRGYVLRRLQASAAGNRMTNKPNWPWWLASSAVFGAMHGAAWLPGILAGLGYSWLVCRRNKLGDGIAAHCLTNAGLAIYAALTDSFFD